MRRWVKIAVVLSAFGMLALLVVPAAFIAASSGGSAVAMSCPAPGPPSVVASSDQLDAAQLAIAGTIIGVAHQAGVGDQGAVIGLITGLQESRLTNDAPGVGGGGSVGVFQQIAADGWGSVADELDPVKAAGMFFGVRPDLSHDTGLTEVPGWQQMTPTVAAQAVQRSAFPDAYAKWVPLAQSLVAGAVSSGSSVVLDNCVQDGTVTLPSGTKLPGAVAAAIRQAPVQIQTAISFALSQLGCKYTWGATGPCSTGFDCSGLVQSAYAAAGIAVPRTSEAQYAGLPAVLLSALQPGDLVFEEGLPPGHVVLYLGGGWVVQAPHTGAVVFAGPLDSGSVGAARVLPTSAT